MKKICLFAGYSPTNKIDCYVVDYLKELSKFADIYYLADNELDELELKKISLYTKNAWGKRHRKYDFGSYSELAKNYVGWDVISKYDELILANDSCFCMQSFNKVFDKMDNLVLDSWSLTATDEFNLYNTYLAQEYILTRELHSANFCFNTNFIAFRHNIIADERFVSFLNNVTQEISREQVCVKYEFKLTKFLLNNKFTVSTFISRIYPLVFIYGYDAVVLLKEGMPLLKKRIFFDNPNNIKPSLLCDMFDISLEYIKGFSHYIRKPKSKVSITKYIENFAHKHIKVLKNHKVSRRYRKNFKTEEKLQAYIPSQINNYEIIQENLANEYCSSEKIVLFFSVSRDLIGGGLLSINRFIEHSQELSETFAFDLCLSGLPFFNAAINHTMFTSILPMVDFSYLIKNPPPEEVLINIPEVFLKIFIDDLKHEIKIWLSKVKVLRINILNQNNCLMPSVELVHLLFNITPLISISCAHKKYCTQELANRYIVPVYFLPPFLPEFYKIDVSKKENIIVLSPDSEMLGSGEISKKLIIDKISKELPHYEIVIVNDMTIEEYKVLISKAKYTITFGEGYDGYFIEPYLSKSIGFAVFNKEFFPLEFDDVKTVYKSWDLLYENVTSDIKKLDNDHNLYSATCQRVTKVISKHTNNDESLEYLKKFYSNTPYHMPKVDELLLFPIIETLLHQGVSINDDIVVCPDGTTLINRHGDMYSVLYEIYIRQIYNIYIPEDFILIDLGACFGISTLYFCKNFENCIKVYGFEPVKASYEIAKRNIEKNVNIKNKVILKNIGLSNYEGEISIQYVPDWAPATSTQNNCFIPEMTRLSNYNEIISTEVVKIRFAHSELESIINNHETEKIVLKCDIEGAEFEVMSNLFEKGLLHKIDVLILETHFRDPNSITKLLKKSGFVYTKQFDYIPNNIYLLFGVQMK